MRYNTTMFNILRLLSRTTAIVAGISFIAPLSVLAANITAPIVPQGTCPLGYGAFFKVIQNLVNDSIIFASFIAVILIAYAGFLFVTNSASPDNLAKGRKILMSTVIGFIIVISAWLIVNEFISIFTTGNLASLTAILQPVSGAGNCLSRT